MVRKTLEEWCSIPPGFRISGSNFFLPGAPNQFLMEFGLDDRLRDQDECPPLSGW